MENTVLKPVLSTSDVSDDLASSLQDLHLPTVLPVYKGPKSGFLHRVKVIQEKNSGVFLPKLNKSHTSALQRSKTLMHSDRTQSNESLHHNSLRSTPTNLASLSLLFGSQPNLHVSSLTGLLPKKLKNQLSRSLPDLPAIFEQDETDKSQTEFVTISNLKHLHCEKLSDKAFLPPIDPASQYKFDSGCPTETKLIPTKIGSKSNLAAEYLRLNKKNKVESLPQLSQMSQFMVRGQSFAQDRKKVKHTQKWKKGCDCLRCNMMCQQFKEKDIKAYQLWGTYPCQKPQTLFEDDQSDSSSISAS